MTKKRSAPRANKAAAGSPGAQQALREAWTSTREALSKAEAEVERQVRSLLKNNRIKVDDAAELLREFRASLDKERKRRMKELEPRLAQLQARVKKQSRNLARMADETVQSGLAALNIPSRREVTELTRKVEELSRRIGAMRRGKR